MVVMKCFFPRLLRNKAADAFADDSFITVPCRRCYACLSNQRRSWLFRLSYEYIVTPVTVFLTLTYSEDNRPPCLSPYHLRVFLTSLPFKHKFYAIGEYGTHTLRPHYHAVLFIKDNIDGLDLDGVLSSVWRFGFVCCSSCNYRRLNYILHYHTRPKNPLPGLETFSIQSKGLGLNFIYSPDGSFRRDIVDYIRSGGRVLQGMDGTPYVIPRYYIRKLEELGIIEKLPFQTSPDFYSEFISRSFNDLPLYQISDSDISNLLHQLFYIDDKRMRSYNLQNKFFTSYE